MTTLKSPFKYQGIKTKLVPWITEIANYQQHERWVEPFFGSGVVGFNINPTSAVFADHNPHTITFFKKLQDSSFSNNVISILEKMSANLMIQGEPYFYHIREEFNKTFDPVLLLFLNHTSYNGVMRFNGSGFYNVPFGKNPNKLSKEYIYMLYERMTELSKRINDNWGFAVAEFEDVLANTGEGDIIYCDPPYINRVSNYYDAWTEDDERKLHELLSGTKARFVLSTWQEANGEKNEFVTGLWGSFNRVIKAHRYNVGQKKVNRYPVTEVLIKNF